MQNTEIFYKHPVITIIIIAVLGWYILYSLIRDMFRVHDKILTKRKEKSLIKENISISNADSLARQKMLDRKREVDAQYKNNLPNTLIIKENLEVNKENSFKDLREKRKIESGYYNLTEEEREASKRRVYDSDYMRDIDSNS